MEELLIKCDDAATCFLEGTARFLAPNASATVLASLFPPSYCDAVVFARVGVSFSLEKRVSEVITVQERILPNVTTEEVHPWDEIVYGVKRPPKTLFRCFALVLLWFRC